VDSGCRNAPLTTPLPSPAAPKTQASPPHYLGTPAPPPLAATGCSAYPLGMLLARRTIIAGLLGLPLAGAAASAFAKPLDAGDMGVKPHATEDQSGPLQDAILKAASEGRRLALPSGTYFVGNLQIPGGLVLEGVPGATVLACSTDGPVARISGSAGVRLDGLTFTAGNGSPTANDQGLLVVSASTDIHLVNCDFKGGHANGLVVNDASVEVSDCMFTDHALAAIFAYDSRGVTARGNRIVHCGNGGILVWGSKPRHDGSVLSGNTITSIGWTNGGNGQNGNGINVFRCGDVIVSDNQIAQCAFSAIRLNTTMNVAVTGNVCRSAGEVAIFSEFGFSGSVIADNIVDGAAAGISITNMDQGGRLATCSGNIVRNIAARSEVNPDTRPVGIYVEADTAVTGNTVDAVPGIGILAGNGPFLRNVIVSSNMISGAETGIAVTTVREAQTGSALISGNLISGATTPLAGRAWDEVTSTDLAGDAAKFPNLTVAGNVAG